MRRQAEEPPPSDFSRGWELSERVSRHGLDAQGIETTAKLHWNLTTAPLVEQAIARGEGELTKDGALLVDTGKFTGRSVKTNISSATRPPKAPSTGARSTSRWTRTIGPT